MFIHFLILIFLCVNLHTSRERRKERKKSDGLCAVSYEFAKVCNYLFIKEWSERMLFFFFFILHHFTSCRIRIHWGWFCMWLRFSSCMAYLNFDMAIGMDYIKKCSVMLVTINIRGDGLLWCWITQKRASSNDWR